MNAKRASRKRAKRPRFDWSGKTDEYLMTMGELADAMNMKVHSLYNRWKDVEWRKKKHLPAPAINDGRMIRFRLGDVRAAINGTAE